MPEPNLGINIVLLTSATLRVAGSFLFPQRTKTIHEITRTARNSMRSHKLNRLIEEGTLFPEPLATQKAALSSEAGMEAPCDEEMEAIFDEIAAVLGGTFNNFQNESGETKYDWQFHLPAGVTIESMRSEMRNLGFMEFRNLNFRSHYPTLPFDLGGFHWQGNVRGNWYHIEFRRTARGRNEVHAVDAHYDADRPSFIFHRTATGKRKRGEP